MREELDDAREHRLWMIVLRGLATSVLLAGVLGTLWAVSAALGWSGSPLLRVLGLVAGGAIAVAATGSARGRERTGLVLGAVTLPLLAAHLASVGARDEAAFEAYGARLTPFLAHAAGALLGGLAIWALWRLPRRIDAGEDDAEAVPPEATVASIPPASTPGERKGGLERAPAPSAGGATP